MNIYELLKERNLPAFLPREEMKKLLIENEYGYIPDIEYTMEVSEPKIIEKRYVTGTVEHTTVDMTIKTKLGSHTFTIHRVLHNDGEKRPFFVYPGILPDVPNRYLPIEEIAENGFDVLTFCYTDVSGPTIDFTNGLAGVIMDGGQAEPSTCGKIGVWAWATMRVMDYAQTLPELDHNQAAVIGHSRLGKTALYAGMLDERFRYVISNCSGCSGAAIARGCLGAKGEVRYFQTGECIESMIRLAPGWYCQKYRDYQQTNVPEGFDQHFLLASIAPRFLYVASAEFDDWADPTSEFLGALAASEYYEKLGLKGLVCGSELPKPGDFFHEGRIAYHRTNGYHFVSRHDWHNYMNYINLHKYDEI